MNTTQVYLDLFFNWQNFLDILLITAALFFLYRTFLGLGTWKIFAGLLAAFLVYVFANLLNLEGVEWVFNNLSHVALIGLIIIFQPEIRKILEKVILLTIPARKKKSDECAEVIADSLWSLAQLNRGAIVVFPGSESIHDKVSGGFKLNALPSKPLIASIFDPHSGGHDGAVIVADGMLTEFAVRLPMSSSSTLSNEYGTRHHAAMGMSEEKDSLVLLVSEERGNVLAFVGGEMKRLSSPAEITAAIDKHFLRFGFKQKAQQMWMSRRTSLQLAASLAVALCFWMTMIVGEKQMVERTITIPVEYTSPTGSFMFIGQRTNELSVHTAGPKSAINEFLLSSPKAVVNLSQFEGGEQNIVMSSDNIKHPDEIRLVDISPREIHINLAPLLQKQVPVVPQLIGQLPPGFTLGKIEIFPKTVEILAPPADSADREVTVSTTPIYLSSVARNTTIVCKIVAPPTIQPADKRWPDVEVKITLEKGSPHTDSTKM